MPKPALLVTHDSTSELRQLEDALHRYAVEYDIVAVPTAEAADRLGSLPDVLVVLAGGSDAADLLGRVPDSQPHADRVLVVPWAPRAATRPLLAAISSGRFERFVFQPTSAADEQFHLVVTELLRDQWVRRELQPKVVTVVGLPGQPRSYELRDLLQRSGLSFDFVTADSDRGRQLLSGVENGAALPLVVRFDGATVANPSNEEAAALVGARHSDDSGIFDLVVVGAGPAGLSATVYGASEGLRTIMVDAETIGGQAGTSSLIRNYVGFPLGLPGAELCNRALEQAWSFGAQTSVLRRATGLTRRDQYYVVTFERHPELVTRCVLLACGAGYRRLDVPSLEALVGASVYYGGGVTEAAALEGQEVFVVGAGNSAGQAAVNLARHARTVHLVVRGDSLARSMSDYLVREITDSANIRVLLRTTITGGGGTSRLEHLDLTEQESGRTRTVPAAALFVLIGATPHTSWLPPAIDLDRHGFVLTDRDLPTGSPRAPLPGETSLPGVFAAGDVRHGSVKRVAAAVGEGSMCVRSVHQYLAELRETRGPADAEAS